MNIGRLCISLILAGLVVVALAFAGNTGKIAGKITDSVTGEPLPSANVIVKRATGSAGLYVQLPVR